MKMPIRPSLRALVVAALTVGLALPSQAVAPALLLMFKQIGKQAATSMFKDAVLSGLSGMGCKGIALSNALAAFDLRRGAAAATGGMPGMPVLPAGMTMPTMPTMPAAAGLPSAAGLPLLPQGTAIPPEIAARMGALMPGIGQMPAGTTLDPEQMAMLARIQQAMAQPLSAPETLAVIDDLAQLGFLPKAMQAELKECLVLVPSAGAALGMGMGMLKPMVPQLRQAREQLHALPPAEQDEVAAALAQEVQELPADQRAELIEHLDSGFFPPRVSAGVKQRIGARPSK